MHSTSSDMNLKNLQNAQSSNNIEWAKVTHNNVVKRISNPKRNLNEFLTQVKGHFKDLRDRSYLYPSGEGKANMN